MKRDQADDGPAFNPLEFLATATAAAILLGTAYGWWRVAKWLVGLFVTH